MSHATDLVQAVLREQCAAADQALRLLDAALELEVDPLDYFAHRFGLSRDLVFGRAADWLGVAFSPVVPLTGDAPPRYDRLDSLGQTRMLRLTLYDREVAYFAPRFEAFLHLRETLAGSAELRQQLCIVPDSAIRDGLAKVSGAVLLDEARQRLARRWPFASAHLDLPLRARLAFVIGLLTLALSTTLAPFLYRPLLLGPLLVLLGGPAVLRLWAILRPPSGMPAPPLDDAELPVYSVLIPLRDEANMVPLLRRAMLGLHYPAEKLDIKFVVEAASPDTIAAVRPLLADPRFELVVVPDAPPRTKPKALNFALPLLRGRYVVVYDAEDIPDPLQLREAAARFAADPTIDCLQAVLDIDNAGETWLTTLHAGEYAGLFRLFLPLLGQLRLPMPLGGTSNHFRAHALREIGGWDAFNVTEDADIGVRLARLRYRSGTLASRTGEEAPVDLAAWMAQRTRWMKGWMQTFVVHNRSPRRFLGDIGWRGFLMFEVYVGGLIVSPLLHLVLLAGLAAGWAGGRIGDGWDLAYLGLLVLGYGAAFALAVAGLVRAGKPRLILMQMLLPAYWVLHALATVRAAGDLLSRPYFWAKTAHGRTRVER